MSEKVNVSKDTRIMVQGILQAVIHTGADPAEWLRQTQHGYNVARYLARRASGATDDTKPEWRKRQ